MTKRNRLVETVTVVGASIALTIYFTYPLAIQLGNHVAELNDSLLTVYIQAWVTHALVTHPGQLLNMNMYFPAVHTLARSENLLGVQLLFAPVYLLTKSPVLASNAVIFLSFPLCFLAMYLLLRRIIGDPWVAGIGAFIYGFPVCRVAQMRVGHMQLLSMQWIPLIILFMYEFIAGRRLRHLVLMNVCLTLQILCSVYLGYLGLLVTSCFIVAYLICCRSRITLHVIRDLAIGFMLSAIVLLPVLYPYLQLQHDSAVDQTRVTEVTKAGSANPIGSYLDVTGFPHNVYARVLQRYGSKDLGWEKRLFIGFVPIGLCIIAVLSLVTSRKLLLSRERTREESSNGRKQLKAALMVGSILTIGLMYVLSLGPYLRVHDHITKVRLPFFWLRTWVPGMKMFRVPARFGLGLNFGVAVLAAFGFLVLVQIGERIATRHRTVVKIALMIVTCAALSLEFGLSPLDFVPVMTAQDLAPEYRWLARQPTGSVTVELPITYRAPNRPDPYEQVEYVYASVYHWQPIINGVTGYPPKSSYFTYRLASQLPSIGAVTALKQMGVKYVLLHASKLTDSERSTWKRSGLPEVQQFKDGCIVFELSPGAAHEERATTGRP